MSSLRLRTALLIAAIVGWTGPAAAVTLDIRVNASTNDATQDSVGGMLLTDTEMKFDQTTWMGLRFTNVAIPQGAYIKDAYITFRATAAASATTTPTIYGQNVANATTFTTTANNISGRARTTATVSWSIPSWTSGQDYNTTSIKGIVQEIVNRSDWSSGNALAVLINTLTSGADRKTLSFNGNSSLAPLLHIEYVVVTRPVATRLLFVVTNTSSPTAEESQRKAFFEAIGYTVTLIAASDSQAAFDTAAAANDVAYICEAIYSFDLSTKLKSKPLGIVNEEPAITDEFAVTSTFASPSANAVTIAQNNHFITSPYSIGSLAVTSSTQQMNTWTGTLAPDLDVLATIGVEASLAAVEMGGRLYDGTTAAGRRVFLPWSWTAIDLSLLTDDGYVLLSRALAWAGGLVGHWRLDETSGTTANDSSPNNSDGTLQGGPLWTSECSGSGLLFNGTSQYVSVPHASHLSITKSLTLTGWVKSSNLSGWHAVINKGTSGTTSNYYLSTKDNQASFGFYNGGWAEFSTTSANLLPDTWYHLAATFDNTTDQVRVYVDGVALLSTTTTATPVVNSQGLRIGSNENNEHWQGMLRDVRVYNYVLNAAEIAKLSSIGGHWKFAEGTGTTAADSSGAANNATLSGGASWTTSCSGENALLTNGIGGIAQTAAAFTPPSKGTVAFWMRGSGPLSARGRLCGVNGDWEIRQEVNGTLSFDLGASPFVGNEPFSTLDPVDTDGKWYHIAAIFDDVDNSYSVYIDGALRTSGISPVDLVPQAAGTLSFGTRTGSAEYWKGALRDFRVYNRKLCPAEIAELSGFVGHWKFDETSGTMAADSSPAGNNGTLQNSPTWTTGRVDGGLLLNGTSQFVNVPNSASLSATEALTLVGWAKPSSLSGYRIMICKGTSPSVYNYWLGILNDEISFGFYNGAYQEFNTSNVNLTANTWYHLAATFDNPGNTVRVYCNGVEVHSATTTASPTTNSEALTIGKSSAGEYWPGALDDVRLYKRVLCPAEIQALYNGGGSFQGVKIIKWVEIQ